MLLHKHDVEIWDEVMSFLTAYKGKMSHLDEQRRMYDGEKTALTEQLIGRMPKI